MKTLKLYKQKGGDCAPVSLVFLVNNFYNGNLDVDKTVEIARKNYYTIGMLMFDIPLLLHDLEPKYKSIIGIGKGYREYNSQFVDKKLKKVKETLGDILEVEVIDEREFYPISKGEYLRKEKPFIIRIGESDGRFVFGHAVVVVGADDKSVFYFCPREGKVLQKTLREFLDYVEDSNGIRLFKIRTD